MTEQTFPLYFAHSNTEDEQSWHRLHQHLKSTAVLAKKFGDAGGFGELAYLAGWLHDLGKYSEQFQQRLRGGPPVNHSTAGAKVVFEKYGEAVGTLLAYPLLGHHGGLLDYGGSHEPQKDSVYKRLNRPLADFSSYQKEVRLPRQLDLAWLKHWHLQPGREGFSISFLIRMIYSSLVDADFIDTETFFGKNVKKRRQNNLKTLLKRFNTYIKKFQKNDTEINAWRTKTLQWCIQKGQDELPGLFSLTVPTGGGKTISSMAFALNHAVHHQMRRIIYVIPFTAIIEQNADIFKQILGEENVLEHHSNFDWDMAKSNISEKTYLRLKKASENWDIPVVVTTNVQFFESLFSRSPFRSRKLHNIARSVIVFDEAQMLPREYLIPAMSAVWELVKNYGCSAVFCTATQPDLRRFLPKKDEPIREIVPNPSALFDFYKRVEIEKLGQISDDELAYRLSQHSQVLCVVNTRKHAQALFYALNDSHTFHLSTLMCPAHRRTILQEVRKRLSEGQPCRLISTSLIEAGVDIDFPVGYRAMVGLDSINQTAGRINREMKRTGSKLYIFEPASPHIKKLPSYISQGAEITRLVSSLVHNLQSTQAVQAYFDRLYLTGDASRWDKSRIMECFRDAKTWQFDFQTAAEKFRLIDSPTYSVVIPYTQHAHNLIQILLGDPTQIPPFLLRGLQPYIIQIYAHEYWAMVGQGVINPIGDGQMGVLKKEFMGDYYDNSIGLRLLPHTSEEDLLDGC